MNFHVIIPARYQSTRLPGKPLALIGGIPMIIHVCKKAKQSGAASVSVATDDPRIVEVVLESGYKAVMTKKEHPSGSDRIFEAAQTLGLNHSDIIVNLQGDEPFIPPENITQVATILAESGVSMASLCCPIVDKEQFNNPDCVKVVLDQLQQALYFSRSPIPYHRENAQTNSNQPASIFGYRHIGIYAYRYAFLNDYIKWPESDLEALEKLEQLRVLSQGMKIKLGLLKVPPQNGVDNQQDLKAANNYYQSISQ